MSGNRRATKPLNEDAVRAADAAVGGGRLGTGPEDAELRKKWMDAYVAAGGRVSEVKPKGRSPSGSIVGCQSKPLLWVTLVSVTFTTDHGLLTDKFSASKDPNSELDRWTPGGRKYSDLDPKEWTPAHNFPISQTKGTTLSLIAEFEAGPPDAAPARGFITAVSKLWTFTAKATFHPTNGQKTNTVKVPMTGDLLPEEIQKLKEKLEWEVEVCGKTFTFSSGPHTVYVTYDVPRAFPDRAHVDFDDPDLKHTFPPQPLGVTLKRMDKSVELVEPGDNTEPVKRKIWEFDPAQPTKLREATVTLTRPHLIVRNLMGLFKDYELNAKATLAKFDHPTYMNMGVGGTWGIADYLEDEAECQAIVRFVRNVINQLGVPGTAETRHVFAKPESPNVAEESPDKVGYGGKHALVDRPISDSDIGKVFPPSHSVIDGKTSMGFNQYEACLMFTHGGLTLYYGGGAGVYKDRHAVLRAFNALVEVEGAWWPSDSDRRQIGFRIKKILARYQ